MRPYTTGIITDYTHAIPRLYLHLYQVLSEFAPDSHSLVKPVRVPKCPIKLKFLRHSDSE